MIRNSLETRVLGWTFPRLLNGADPPSLPLSLLLPDFGKQAVRIHRDQWCASHRSGKSILGCAESKLAFHATFVASLCAFMRRPSATSGEGCPAVCDEGKKCHCRCECINHIPPKQCYALNSLTLINDLTATEKGERLG